MNFQEYFKIDGIVKACRLQVNTAQSIADSLSAGVTMGALASLEAKRSDLTNCMEYSFRYSDDTARIVLTTGDWLVQLPNGKFNVVNHDVFIKTFYNNEVDYYIADVDRQTVESAFLKYINIHFPELYTMNTEPALVPYKTITPNAVTNTGLETSIAGGAVIIKGPAEDSTGADVANTTITVEFEEDLQFSTYVIAMLPDSFNAPKSWTVMGYSSKAESKVLSTLTATDTKPGHYRIVEPFLANKLVITFTDFEDAAQVFGGIRISFVTGGQPVVQPEPSPLTKLTPAVLEAVAEKLISWYNAAGDRYELNFAMKGITNFDGLAMITDALMKASFIKETTSIAYNFTNDATPNAIINQFNYHALQQFVYELHLLDDVNGARVSELNFASASDGVLSAVGKSVTNDTESLWISFRDMVMKITKISQPSQIRK